MHFRIFLAITCVVVGLIPACSADQVFSVAASSGGGSKETTARTAQEVVAIWENGSSTGDFETVGDILGDNIHYTDAQYSVAGKDKTLAILKLYAAESGGGLPNFKLRDVTYGSGKALGKIIVTAEFRPNNAPAPIIFGEAITVENGQIVDYFSAYSLPTNP